MFKHQYNTLTEYDHVSLTTLTLTLTFGSTFCAHLGWRLLNVCFIITKSTIPDFNSCKSWLSQKLLVVSKSSHVAIANHVANIVKITNN